MSVVPQGTDSLMGQRTQVPGHYSSFGQMHGEAECRTGCRDDRMEYVGGMPGLGASDLMNQGSQSLEGLGCSVAEGWSNVA